ncbi:hypothetical protein P4V41_07645 [Fictibacillus nanhaiensis]|uniref:hypothetical protein n=1 Tax=Fictibacillus nanhaiensis TaxID=742169 RepID=UPI002E1F3959|nr:hypothetical protein [Fictibacillus nanhaiensis]
MKDTTYGVWGTNNEECVVMKQYEATFDLVMPVTMRFNAEDMEMAEEFMSNLQYRILHEGTSFLKMIEGSVHKVQHISDPEVDVKDIEEIEKVADLLGKTNDKK